MNVELVAQMFKNYRSNVLFHLEGETLRPGPFGPAHNVNRNGRPPRTIMKRYWMKRGRARARLSNMAFGNERIHVVYEHNMQN